MTKEQQVTKQSLFENGTADYASPAHLIEQYKAGNCPLGDVQASIESIMEQYAEEKAIEFANWQYENDIKCFSFDNDVWIDRKNDDCYSLKEVYEKFIQSKETNNG